MTDPDEMGIWETLSSRLLLDRSPWLKVYSEDLKLPEGRIVEGYLRLRTPDFVVIVPASTDGQIGMIRSYKRGPDRIDLQPPAGMIEPGENPLSAAKRELLEEMGCKADSWRELGDYVLAGNLRGGFAYLFLAEGCRQVQPPDSGDLEAQQVLWLDRNEVTRLWRQGELAQLGSSAALGLALAHLDGDYRHD
ncbi:MAG: NUDIX hydrolase [Anaerolineales bacterium]